MTYYTSETTLGALLIYRRDADGRVCSFTEDAANADWQAYQEWLAEGNTPEPWPPAES